MRSYDEINQRHHGRKKLFINYSDLRYKVACNLQMVDHTEFDKKFSELMNSSYKRFINLHGAPTGEYDELSNFTYKGRLYPFISLVTK